MTTTGATCGAYVHHLPNRGTCGRPAKWVWTVPATGQRMALCGTHVWRYAEEDQVEAVVALTDTQAATLAAMAQDGGRLVRRPGGFWTTPNTGTNKYGAPDWYVSVQTVRAMERKGLLRRTHELPEEWRDPRVSVDNDHHLVDNPIDTTPTLA